MRHVPFDPDWYAIGCIEPEFVTKIVGWANEEILCDAGMIPVRSWSSDTPVSWVPEAFTRQPLPEPIPIKKTTLKWVWVD